MDPPLEGAVGGADEGDNDSSYAKVKDIGTSNNGNHPYATVQDKKVLIFRCFSCKIHMGVEQKERKIIIVIRVYINVIRYM